MGDELKEEINAGSKEKRVATFQKNSEKHLDDPQYYGHFHLEGVGHLDVVGGRQPDNVHAKVVSAVSFFGPFSVFQRCLASAPVDSDTHEFVLHKSHEKRKKSH